MLLSKRIFLTALLIAAFVLAPLATPAFADVGDIESDEFNDDTLTGWTVVSTGTPPATVVEAGGAVTFDIPGGGDQYTFSATNQNAPQLLQDTANLTSFTISAKFNDFDTTATTIQGLAVHGVYTPVATPHDAFMRFSINSTGTAGQIRAFAAFYEFVGGIWNPIVMTNGQVDISAFPGANTTGPVYLRVTRQPVVDEPTRSVWSFDVSFDGTTWTNVPFVPENATTGPGMVVDQVGIFAGTSTAVPFTTAVDWFHADAVTQEPVPATITEVVTPTGEGTIDITPAGPYEVGDTVSIDVTDLDATDTFEFQHLIINGDTANPITTLPYDFTIPQASNEVEAVFVDVGTPVTLTATVSPVGEGTVTVNPAAGPYLVGDTVTFTVADADATDTFIFDHWLVNDVETAGTTATTLELTLAEATTDVVAVFVDSTANEVTVTAITNPDGAGNLTITPSTGPYEIGDTVIFAVADANTGDTVVFDHWTVNGVTVAGDTGTPTQLTLVLEDDTAVVAVFTGAIEYTEFLYLPFVSKMP